MAKKKELHRRLCVDWNWQKVIDAGHDPEVIESKIRDTWEYDGSGFGFGCRDFDAWYEEKEKAQFDKDLEALENIASQHLDDENESVIDVYFCEFYNCGVCDDYYDPDEGCMSCKDPSSTCW